MSSPARATFAAYSDPERKDMPDDPPVERGEGGEVWNPCGGHYVTHRCAKLGCINRAGRCTQDGKRRLVSCPRRAQAPWKLVGRSLYKYAQCGDCRARERADGGET